MSRIHLTLIVPTKDRPKDLEELFKSITAQKRAADLVIVVDGSDNPIEFVLKKFPNVPTKYVRVRPPSLPKQRNAGLEALPPEAQWVGFLDDDLVLEPDALAEMETFLLANRNDQLKGVGLTIINQPTTVTTFYNSFFLLGHPVGGRVTKSGYSSAIPPVTSDIDVDWLYGGATFWEKSIFKEFNYDEWFQGTGYMEDVDFSYRVSRRFELKVCSRARCYHYSHPIHRSKQRRIGEWQITSWWYFVQKQKAFSLPAVFWGMTGLTIKNSLSAVVKRSPDAALRTVGNMKGFARIIRGDALTKKGFSK